MLRSLPNEGSTSSEDSDFAHRKLEKSGLKAPIEPASKRDLLKSKSFRTGSGSLRRATLYPVELRVQGEPKPAWVFRSRPAIGLGQPEGAASFMSGRCGALSERSHPDRRGRAGALSGILRVLCAVQVRPAHDASSVARPPPAQPSLRRMVMAPRGTPVALLDA
jgi:hypothetical protein